MILRLLPAALLVAIALPPCRSERPSAVRPRQPSPLFDPALTHTLLEEPGRDRWQQPERIVRELRVRRGGRVADVGAGSGYLLPHLSRAVGPTGIVFAEEIQPDFLPDLRRKARKLGNARVILGTAADPKLPRGEIDLFVLLTVYHEVQSPVEFLRALRRCAAPAARLAIIDFDPDRLPREPRAPGPPAGHAVPERDVLAEAAAAGWKLVERHEFLPAAQFFLVFQAD